MAADAARTKQAVAKSAVAAYAVNFLATAAEPKAPARRLNLADHARVLNCLHATSFYLAYAAQHTGNGIQFLYGENGKDSGGRDLQRILIDSGSDIRHAAHKIREAGRDAERDARALEQKPGSRSLRLVHAASQAADSVQGLQEALRRIRYGVRVAGWAKIALDLHDMTGYLTSAFSHESMLVDWRYEEARWPQRSAVVSGSLCSALSDLRGASRRLAVACVVLRDDESLGLSRRAS